MLSKKMYNLLKQIPRFPETIPYESLKKKTFKTTAAMDSLLLEAKSDEYNYIYQHEGSKSSTINKSRFRFLKMESLLLRTISGSIEMILLLKRL